MPRRLLRTLLPGATAALVGGLLGLGLTVPAGPAVAQVVPDCPPVTVQDSTKNARAVFSGTVTGIERLPRTDGQPGANYLQSVTVDMVYQGRIATETVQVLTDRNREACSLGALAVDTEYMFFVTGTGEPWVALGTSGTRLNSDTVIAEVESILGEGEPPIDPAPEPAEFTPVGAGEPQSLSRTAAPGAALVLIGLLGLLVVRGVGRRSR